MQEYDFVKDGLFASHMVYKPILQMTQELFTGRYDYEPGENSSRSAVIREITTVPGVVQSTRRATTWARTTCMALSRPR